MWTQSDVGKVDSNLWRMKHWVINQEKAYHVCRFQSIKENFCKERARSFQWCPYPVRAFLCCFSGDQAWLLENIQVMVDSLWFTERRRESLHFYLFVLPIVPPSQLPSHTKTHTNIHPTSCHMHLSCFLINFVLLSLFSFSSLTNPLHSHPLHQLHSSNLYFPLFCSIFVHFGATHDYVQNLYLVLCIGITPSCMQKKKTGSSTCKKKTGSSTCKVNVLPTVFIAALALPSVLGIHFAPISFTICHLSQHNFR